MYFQSFLNFCKNLSIFPFDNFSVSLYNTKIAQIIIMVEEWYHPIKQVVQNFGVTSTRVYQPDEILHKSGEYPLLQKHE